MIRTRPGPALIVSAVATTAASVALAAGTGDDLIPDIPLGSHVVELEAIANVGPSALIEIASPPDGSGRLFLVSPEGVIRILKGGSVLPTPFHDVPAFPAFQAMTSMVFHPDFATNRKLYIITGEEAASPTPDYSSPQDDSASAYDNVLCEYLADANAPDLIDVTSRRELLRVRQPHTIHSLNDLVFGADGYLYIASGDGGETRDGTPTNYNTNGPLTDNPFGAILRIDVDQMGPNGRYAIPPDNPFADGAGGNAPEIYAWGLRNPWRMTRDRLTGEIYTGVNGDFTIEQVYRIRLGDNYGWDVREGSFLWDAVTGDASSDPNPDPQLTPPLAEYDHNNSDEAYGSVISGYVYRGSRIPSLYGQFLLLDWRAGEMMVMNTTSGELERVAIDTRGVSLLPNSGVTWGEDEDGELYLGTLAGDLLRLVPTAPGDAAGVASPTLTVARDAGDDLLLSWGASCVPDDDYEVYEGSLPNFVSHVPNVCSTAGAISATVSPAIGDTYYLVVPRRGVREGSYGTDGAGAERPVGLTPCLLQSIAACNRS